MTTVVLDSPGAHDVATLAERLEAEPADLPEAALIEHVLALHHLRARLDGALSAATSAFDAKKTWAADGARSGASWLAARAEVSSTAAKADVLLARHLRSMPVVEAAFRAGRLGRAKVLMLAKVHTPELVEVFADQEQYLVDQVSGLRVDHARRFLVRWQQMARQQTGWIDPYDPVDETAPRAAVNLSPTFGGRFVLDGELDAEHGAIVRSIIGAEVDEMFRVGVFGLDDGLTPAERRGQALVQILLRKGRVGMKHGRPLPSVEIICDERSLAAEPIADAEDLAARICEIVEGGPIHLRTAQRLLCEGTAHRLVLSANGEVLDAGFDIRLANRAQRRALCHRDGGCAFPGCSAPSDWCEAHHAIPYDPDHQRGPTDMANLVLLCRFHHHRVHEGGFTLILGPDGAVEVRRPDGAPLTPCLARRRSFEPDKLVALARERLRASITEARADRGEGDHPPWRCTRSDRTTPHEPATS